MKKLVYCVLINLIIISFSAQASQWIAKNSLPYEIKTLVESFNMDYLTDEEKNDLKSELHTLDSLMTNLSVNDRFFLAKSSVYKWILKYPPQVRPPADFTLTTFTDKTKSKGLNPFAKWLLLALKSDSFDIQKNANYQQYLKLKNRKKIPFNFLSLKKRIDLLRPWAYLFYRNQGEQLNLQLTKHQFTLLRDIVSQYKLFYRFKGTRLPNIEEQKLSLFSFQEKTGQENQKDSIEESLSQLDQVIAKHRKAGIPTPVDEWSISKNDDWTPGDKQGLVIEPSPNYTPPKNLPKPVDDWNE